MTHAPNGKTYEESHIKSEGGNPLTKFVNLLQTPEERQDKYAFCRSFGLSVHRARVLRDWHWTKINLFIYAYLHPQQLPLPIDAPGGAPGAATKGAIG
jgi:hypothetical protein